MPSSSTPSSSESRAIKSVTYPAEGGSASRGQVLVVIAHPDDEVFASGTICLCASSGFRITLVCVTDGAAGGQEVLETDPAPAVMAEVRRRELELSAWALGVSEVSHLGQPDVAAEDWPGHPGWTDADVIGDLAAVIGRLQPQLILTHGPMGGYGHPAHIQCFRCVEAACRETGFTGSLFSFCGEVEGAHFARHFDQPSDVLVDVRDFLKPRTASVAYHQTQAATFLQPYWPTTVKARLSALFGMAFPFIPAGRRREPIATPGRFCRRFPVEGLVLQRPPTGQAHFFAAHFGHDRRVRLSPRPAEVTAH